MKILKICIVFSVALASARLAAADLTVASGSPYDVTASETYSNVYASDKVAISPSVTLTASSYALQADAAADAGCVDAVSIGQGASFVVNSLGNANSATGRIVFAGANAKISKSSNTWGSTWFGSGRWELVGDAGADINLAVQGSWSGGNFNVSGVGVRLTGDGNVKISAGWTNNRSQGLMNFNSGFAFANSGTVTLTSDYWGTYVVNSDGVFAPSVAGVHLQRGSYKSSCVTLRIAAGKVAAIKTLEAYDGGSCQGSGTIRMGEDDSNGILKANIEGMDLTIEKVGSGTLTVSSTTNLPNLVVRGGVVCLKSALPIGRLTIEQGASVVVDGCVVSVAASDAASAGRISTANGGSVKAAVDCSSLTEIRSDSAIASGVTLEKTGVGKLVFFGDKVGSGSYEVNGGAVAFSKLGLSDEYFRFTFKQVLGWINYSNVLQEPSYLRLKQIAFFGTDGSRRLSGDDAFLDQKYDMPHELAPGGATVPEGTEFDSDAEEWNRSIGYIFSSNQGIYPRFGAPALTNEADVATWKIVTCRLPSGAPKMDGYSFQSEYNFGVPCAWTIESSKTGLDGEWRVVADVSGYSSSALTYNHNAGWLDGFAGKGDGSVTNFAGRLAEHFHYIEPGVEAADSPLKVSLANGGKMDFSAVTGGQPIDEIACDISAGGGELVNVTVSANGVLKLSGDGCGGQTIQVPLALTDVHDADNFDTWSVSVNGLVNEKYHVRCRNGALGVFKDGFILTIR